MIHDSFRLMPEQGSTHATQVDLLFLFLVGLSVCFTVAISALIVFFCVKYRRGNTTVDRNVGSESFLLLELSWSVIPLFIFLVIFAWGAGLFFSGYHSPEGAIEVRAVAKQWMWKFQHPNGRREINTLHVPVGQAVKMTMISQDVIHSFYVPVFRTKKDVVPGTYSSTWFQATRKGEFHLFCAEYCGTNHSRMIGRVIVVDPEEYENWLGGNASSQPAATVGQQLFEELRCVTCHRSDGATDRGPSLLGLYGRDVKLSDGRTVTADENYLRESILRPAAKTVPGFQQSMPTYDGQIDEEQLIALIAYIKSLAKP